VVYARRVFLEVAIASAIGVMLVGGPAATNQMPAAAAPAVGEKAPDFTLPGVDGSEVRLSRELQHGPVVLILLRGWPGYQCPFCVRQYGDFIGHRDELSAAGARVIWVYPGMADVKQHADAFAAGATAPPNFRLALDPSLTFTNSYRLRWEGKDETSYPSTFVIDTSGVIRWVQISRTHAGRALAVDVLSALSRLRR
jgi:peroxiredoxin Q/BCP